MPITHSEGKPHSFTVSGNVHYSFFNPRNVTDDLKLSRRVLPRLYYWRFQITCNTLFI